MNNLLAYQVRLIADKLTDFQINKTKEKAVELAKLVMQINKTIEQMEKE